MANETINQQTEDTSPTVDDFLPTWDVTSGTTKKATILNVLLKLITGGSAWAWTSYTPTWTASSINPALGNGSFTGSAYLQMGKTVHFRIILSMGSTTTYGTGSYRFSYPVPPIAASYNSGQNYPVNGNVTAYDSSAAQSYFMWLSNTVVAAVPLFDPVYAATAGSGSLSSELSPTGPFTFAVGDKLIIVGSYEAA